MAEAFPLGLTYGLPIELYHADDSSVSKSGLDDINRSGWHFFANHLAPDRPPREATPAMFAGTLAHCAVLEPNEFDARYVVGPDEDRRTKVWKEFVASLKRGQVAISPEQRDVAFDQAAAVRANPELDRALSLGHAEVSARWVDEATGVVCRCRPDWVWPVGPLDNPEGVVLLDLKTCPSASPTGFARSIVNWRYHVQAAYYIDGYQIASGLPVLGMVFAAVENTYPFAAAAFMLSEEDLELGRRAYRRNLATYAQCLRTQTWPGYPESVQVISLPGWARQQEEFQA